MGNYTTGKLTKITHWL